MLKYVLSIFMMITAACAQGILFQDEMDLKMCGSWSRHFDDSSKECVYCAHGLHYDVTGKCVGTPDVIGKCYGEDHYHAATQECMVCANGHAFNESTRRCEKIP